MWKHGTSKDYQWHPVRIKALKGLHVPSVYSYHSFCALCQLQKKPMNPKKEHYYKWRHKSRNFDPNIRRAIYSLQRCCLLTRFQFVTGPQGLVQDCVHPLGTLVSWDLDVCLSKKQWCYVTRLNCTNCFLWRPITALFISFQRKTSKSHET